MEYKNKLRKYLLRSKKTGLILMRSEWNGGAE